MRSAAWDAPVGAPVASWLVYVFFFLMTRRPPRSPLFPYPPLFRSLFQLAAWAAPAPSGASWFVTGKTGSLDRKSTRLNSSHANISYSAFCFEQQENEACVQPALGKLLGEVAAENCGDCA